MFIIAEILRDIRDNVHLSQDISQKINTLSANKKIFYTFDNNLYDIIYSRLHNR